MLRLRAAVSAASILAASAAACIWDRDTLRDETRDLPQVFDLITGQFEHHGKGYYEARLAECQRTLGTDNVDVQVRNDMGVALLKLARYDESLAVFKKLESEDPKRYETLSNLGVLLKKMGRFTEAADYTAKALEIKPEGHLGMRDFYVKMLRWRAAVAGDASTPPTESFLGQPYPENTSHSPRLSDEDLDRLLSLIRSDKSFVDAYLVLGDDLHGRGHLNLAFWSWTRALQLGHPRADLLKARLKSTFGHWQRQAVGGRGDMDHKDVDEAIAAVTKDLVTAAEWQKTFESVEGEMVAGNPGVQFEDVAAELKKRGIARVEPSEHGLRNTIQDEMEEERKGAEAAAKRKSDARAAAAASKRERVAAAETKSRKSMTLLASGAAGITILAVGLLLIRKR